MVNLDIESKKFREDGIKLRISRAYTSREDVIQGQWAVENEDGVLFRNPHDTEPNLSPVKAALNTEPSIRERGVAKNVTVKSDRSVNEDYYLDPITVYVLDMKGRMPMAMDENGDYGVGGTYTEAVYNLEGIIQLMD